MVVDNPFPVNGYLSPPLFCDREEETVTLSSALRNGRNVLLHSPRRYGKTGLIHHVFNGLARVRGVRTVFADVYAAHDAHEFNTILLNAVHRALNPTPKQFLNNVMAWFSALRPVISVDELTGKPSISLERGDTGQDAATTREIFRILNEHERTIFLAIDEFQQVATFPDIRMDAVLRTELQQSPKVRCIFSGSQRHILLDLFIAASERKTISVTSACIGAAVPSTTGLRWLKVLETEGLVVREHDPDDSRRINVRLTADAFIKMCDYFRHSSRPVQPVGWIADREPRCAPEYRPAA